MTLLFVPIRQGQFHFSETQKKILAEACQKYEGKTVRLIIKPDRHPRSDLQNRYYWGCVLTEIAAETGHTTEELHEVFKEMFLERKFTAIKGKEYPQAKTTTTLSTLEFMEYIDRITAFVAEWGISVPPPEYQC